MKEVGGHGPDWVNKVLEKYPDLSTEVYAQGKTIHFRNESMKLGISSYPSADSLGFPTVRIILLSWA